MISTNLAFWLAIGLLAWAGLGGIIGSAIGTFIHNADRHEEELIENWDWPRRDHGEA